MVLRDVHGNRRLRGSHGLYILFVSVMFGHWLNWTGTGVDTIGSQWRRLGRVGGLSIGVFTTHIK